MMLAGVEMRVQSKNVIPLMAYGPEIQNRDVLLRRLVRCGPQTRVGVEGACAAPAFHLASLA